MLTLFLADKGIAALPRGIGDGRASSVARGRSGDVRPASPCNAETSSNYRGATIRHPVSTSLLEVELTVLPDHDGDDATAVITHTATGGGYDETTGTVTVNIDDQFECPPLR